MQFVPISTSSSMTTNGPIDAFAPIFAVGAIAPKNRCPGAERAPDRTIPLRGRTQDRDLRCEACCREFPERKVQR